MSLVTRIVGGVRAMFRHQHEARELDEELRSFVESAAEDHGRRAYPGNRYPRRVGSARDGRVGHGALLSLTGLAIGVAGALALTRAMKSLLYETRPNEPLVFLAACGLLAVGGLLATYLPARRATRVDPLVALRSE